TAASAAARAPLAVESLFAACEAGLFVAFFLFGFAVLGNRAIGGHFGHHARSLLLVTRCTAFAGLAGTAAPAPAPLAPVAVGLGFAAGFFAGRGIFRQPFGL
ncbi:hypothetical protein, partial [Staphylococcus aureus]